MLKQYLLDNVSDEDRQTIEQRFLQDDSFYDEMLALEDELYFDYRQNRLSARERAAFERKFLQSAEDREKSDFAAAFLQATAALAEEKAAFESKIVEKSSSASWRHSLAAFFNFSNPAMKYGLAAASVLLLLGAIGFFIQNANEPDEIANLENKQREQRRQEPVAAQKGDRQTQLGRPLENEKPQTPPDENRTRETEAERAQIDKEIDEARRTNQSPQKAFPQPPKNQTQPPVERRSIAALILSPGFFNRSGGQEMSRVTLSPAVKSLQLNLSLKNAGDFGSYRAAIRKVDDGTEIWSSANLKPLEKSDKKFVLLVIPAKNLQRADYEISLSGVSDAGEAEEIANYYFSVAKNGVEKSK